MSARDERLKRLKPHNAPPETRNTIVVPVRIRKDTYDEYCRVARRMGIAPHRLFVLTLERQKPKWSRPSRAKSHEELPPKH